jgi:ATP-dependent helicase/DNAse subunit B
MEDYIMISQLNDFIFCPYSIYLHNIYSDTTEEIYHATPQTRGRIAHETVEQKTATHDKNTLLSLPVMSEEYGLFVNSVCGTELTWSEETPYFWSLYVNDAPSDSEVSFVPVEPGVVYSYRVKTFTY